MPADPMLADPSFLPTDLDDTAMTLLSEPLQRCHVLLVDDDELIRALLSTLLVMAGYAVHTAASGEEALLALEKAPCQIVLTDWQMPGMDGLMLCRDLRRRDSTGYIYVVMLTVRSSRRDLLLGLSAGADDYVVKGVASEEILARLQVGRRITQLEHALRRSDLENRRMAVTDPLTGVRNRRFLMKSLPSELERARRYKHPLAILSCDLDHFKRVNDSFGHEAGDTVLTAFASRASMCIRQEIDWIARSGGEEFVVVLPETPLMGACQVADRIRAALAAQPIPTCAGPLAVTVSVGTAALESAADLASATTRQLLATADRYLYESKKSGRDRVTSGPVLSPPTRNQYSTRKTNDEIH